MSTSSSCFLCFAILFLTWSSSSDATQCDIPDGLKVKTDHATVACCSVGETTNCPDGCQPVEFDCIDGFTIQATGDTVIDTSLCTGTAWSNVDKLAALCVQNCAIPPGLQVKTDAGTACCSAGETDNCKPSCTPAEFDCVAGYTIQELVDGTIINTAECPSTGTTFTDSTKLAALCVQNKCPTVTGATSVQSCCTENVCTGGCDNVAITCKAGYTGATVTAKCELPGTWTGANAETTCIENCAIPPGLKVKTDAGTACCSAGETDNCKPSCTPAEFDCIDGYTIQELVDGTIINTAECPSTGTTFTDSTKLAALCIQNKCPTVPGATSVQTTNNCCTNNVCTGGCTGVTITCTAGYTGTTATVNCDLPGTWSVANTETETCIKNCDIPAGLKVKTDHATTACCAAGTNTTCPPGCAPAEFDCLDGYTIQATGTNVVNTATCSTTGTTWSDSSKLAALCVKNAATTTAATTTAASGEGPTSWTKSIILFASCVMMLIF